MLVSLSDYQAPASHPSAAKRIAVCGPAVGDAVGVKLGVKSRDATISGITYHGKRVLYAVALSGGAHLYDIDPIRLR